MREVATTYCEKKKIRWTLQVKTVVHRSTDGFFKDILIPTANAQVTTVCEFAVKSKECLCSSSDHTTVPDPVKGLSAKWAASPEL